MSKIATWDNIKSYSGIGSGGSQCPTESSILNASLDLTVAGTYASTQLVKCEDISYYSLSIVTAPVQGGYGSYKITKITIPSGGSGTPTQMDVTSQFDCESSDTSVCTIPSPGVLYGVKQGSCSIKRKVGGASVSVTVSAPTTYIYTVQINTTPSTAFVTLTEPSGVGGWTLSNLGKTATFSSTSISVTVHYQVSASGYQIAMGTVTVTSSNTSVTKSVTLEANLEPTVSGSGPWVLTNNTSDTIYFRWKYKTSSAGSFAYSPSSTGYLTLAAGASSTNFGSSTFVHVSVQWGKIYNYNNQQYCSKRLICDII